MRKHRLTILGLLGFMAFTSMQAQTNSAKEPQPIVYTLQQQPFGLDHYKSGYYYYNNGKVYSMRSYKVADGQKILQLKVSPAGSTYAILDSKQGKDAKEDKNTIRIFDLWKAKKELAKIQPTSYQPVAFCYSADAKQLLVMGSDKQIHRFDAISSFAEQGAFACSTQASSMLASPGGYFVALTQGNNVEVMNLQQQNRRTLLQQKAEVRDVAFSADGSQMAILTANGECNVYDTSNFKASLHYDALGTAQSCYFHPEGKYLAVVTGTNRVALINLFNSEERNYVDALASGVKYVNFAKSASQGVYLVYNTQQAIVFSPVFHLSPNLQGQLKNELESRMEEWSKRMADESLDDYNARVNEENRLKQMRLFETEIATEMASNLLSTSEVKVGNYNEEMGMLALEFSNMPSIYLNVPSEELSDFMDPGNLEFSNAKYQVNDKDQFELVYTEVTNKKTGQKYVFDNSERKSLAYLKNSDNFVPLEKVQMSHQEALNLEEVKNSILKNAKGRKGGITDHTQIAVSTKVTNTTNAAGKKEMNYEVAVSYTVDETYSAKDDFAPGKYKTAQSKAALTMLQVIKQAMEGDFAKYLQSGEQLKVMVTGTADAMPLSRTIAYDGSYGNFEREPVYQNGELGNITVTRKTGIRNNEQLAFLRAMGVKDYIVREIPALDKMKASYDTNIEVSEKTGSKYRRIGVKFTFIDAFKK